MLRKYQAVFATLSVTSTFSTKRSTSPALPVRRVRELLRPFILAVHPDRYHGPENQEIKPKIKNMINYKLVEIDEVEMKVVTPWFGPLTL